MPSPQEYPDSSWSMLGTIIGTILALSAGVAAVQGIAQAGWLVPALLVGGVVAVAGAGRAGAAPPWLRFHGTPIPLGGEATWATPLALWRAGWLRRTGWPIGTFATLGGLLHLTVRITDKAQCESVLILGPVGRGKTDSVLVPIARSEADQPPGQQHSLVLLDLKGDVLEKARSALARTHRILVFNPSEPAASTVAFDPLAWIPQDSKAPDFQEQIEVAASIYLAATYRNDDDGPSSGTTSDPFWQKQPANVVKGIFLHLKALDPSVTLPDVADYLMDVSAEETVRHLTTYPRTGAAKLRGATMRELLYNERARGGVLADLRDRFVLLTDQRVRQVMGRGTMGLFDLDAFLAQPTALFLQVGALGDSTAPLLSVVVATIQQQLVRRTKHGKTLPLGVRFILDEAGNAGRIEGLPIGIAIMRSANVGYVLALQALEQLRANYGAASAEIILRNLTHRLVLGGTADDDAAWVSKNLGHRNAYRDLPSTSATGEESSHFTREEWPLLRPDELRRLHYQVVVDSSHIPPVLLRLRKYTDRK